MIRQFPNLGGVVYESLSDGEGVRMAIFLAGCGHHCDGCHNHHLWDADAGKEITYKVISDLAVAYMERSPILSGITLTGGDPLFNSTATENFLDALIKELGFTPNIWLYTGFEMEQVSNVDLVKRSNTVVDGRFDRTLADKRLAFRGSSNQRIWRKGEDGIFWDVTGLYDGGKDEEHLAV